MGQSKENFKKLISWFNYVINFIFLAIIMRLALSTLIITIKRQTICMRERERGERESIVRTQMGYEWSVEKLKEFWDHTTWSTSNQSINPFVWSNPNLLITIYKPCNCFGRQHSLVYVHICTFASWTLSFAAGLSALDVSMLPLKKFVV